MAQKISIYATGDEFAEISVPLQRAHRSEEPHVSHIRRRFFRIKSATGARGGRKRKPRTYYMVSNRRPSSGVERVAARKNTGVKKKVVNVTIFYGVGIYIHSLSRGRARARKHIASISVKKRA